MKRFFRNLSGAAAVEFALIAPVMLTMYFGMAELTQALLANRRASHVTAAVGDLVAQYPVLTPARVDDIFSISTSLMAPMPTGKLTIRVTSIAVDANSAVTARWSRTHGPVSTTIPAFGLNATVTDVPADLIVAGEALVRADTEYVYDSPLGEVMPDPITLRHTTYLKPRSGVPVDLDD